MKQGKCKVLAVGLPESEHELLTALEDAGFRITIRDTGEQALAQIRNDVVDFIIVNGSIPDLVQICWSLSANTETPILVLLNVDDLVDDDLVDMDALTNAPVDRFFIKPLAIPEVLAHLQAMRRRMAWQNQSPSIPAADDIFQARDLTCCYHSA
jgi:DNA-binding response OmpR family regulator